MNEPMRVGLVGCGDISSAYLRNLTGRFSGARIVSCCSKGGASARKRAEEFGLSATTFEGVLSDPSIDIVLILTPPDSHYELIKAALSAGKHVYSEKALCASYAQAREVTQLAAEKGLYLGSAPDTFLGAAVQTAHQAVRDGLIGEVTSFHADVNRDLEALYTRLRFLLQKSAGIGFDLGVYYLTALLSLLGPVERVCGMIGTSRPDRQVHDPHCADFGEPYTIGNENMMMASLKLKSGVMGTLHFNGDSIFPENPHVMICGTRGIVYIPDPNCYDGKVMLLQKGSKEPVELPYAFGFEENCRGVGLVEMAWSIRAGRPNRASAEMAAHIVETLEGIVTSSKTGQTVSVASCFALPRPLPMGYRDDYLSVNTEIALIR